MTIMNRKAFSQFFFNDDVSIQIALEQNDSFRHFKVGGYIIYYVEINIADRPSASKTGKDRQFAISADELVQEIENISS